MMHRIIAIGYTVFGVSASLFWVIIILYLRLWNPSRYTLGFVIIGIAMINIMGLVYLIRKRADYRRWLIITGVSGNGLSLFVIVYSLVGCLFLQYVFRM